MMKSVTSMYLLSLSCILLLIQVALTEDIVPKELYHDYTQLETFLNNIRSTYPDITRLYSIGTSVQDRELYVMVLGKYPSSNVLLQPKVKYIGNMHGNEAVSRELLINFIEHMAVNYGKNDTITNFLSTTQVHIMPTMNPDGFETAVAKSTQGDCEGLTGRANHDEVDLNRNFPDQFLDNDKTVRAKETRAVMNWLAENQFVLSANLHGGALVASYPYDSSKILKNVQSRPTYSTAPDDDLLIHISKVYSHSHSTMYQGQPCDTLSNEFPDGITNGADWYQVFGGMQDYHYLRAGCIEITVEVACCKFPEASTLPDYWNANKDSLFNFLSEVHRGVLGVVTDEKNNPIKDAMVTVAGRDDFIIRTTGQGEYWRLLLPGTYMLKISAEYHIPEQVNVVIPEGNGAIIQNVTLFKDLYPISDTNIVSSECVTIFMTVLLSVIASAGF